MDEQMTDVLSKVSAGMDVAAAAKCSRLMELFLPPPNVVPLRIRQRTGSVVQPGHPDYDPDMNRLLAVGKEAEEEPAEELAAMLKCTKWTMRLLRETKHGESE